MNSELLYQFSTSYLSYKLTTRITNFTETCFGPSCTGTCIPVLQVCGLVLFGLWFVLYIDRESQLHGQLLHMLPSSGPLITLDKIPAVLAGTGTTILLLSFLGCYGACVESVCFLWLVGFHCFHCHSEYCNKVKVVMIMII